MVSKAERDSISKLTYIPLLVLIVCLIGVSGVFLLSQAVRTAPDQQWTQNGNVFVIGASYVALLVFTIFFHLKRKVAIRRKLQRISKVHKALGKGDAPKAVHNFVAQEFGRACLIAFESQPLETQRVGLGGPGTPWAGADMRKTLLDTIPMIDKRTRLVIEHQPPLMPQARMIHHLRTIVGLFNRDEYGLTAVHYYDSAIQLARYSSIEPTADEFKMGMDAADAIKQLLNEYHLELDTTDASKHEDTSTES